MKKKVNLRDFPATIAQASKELGAGFSAKSLRRRIDSGVFKEGVHYCNLGLGTKRQLRLNVEAIRDLASWRGW